MSDHRRPVPSMTIDGLVDGVYPAMALLAGMQLDVFTAIDQGAASADEVAEVRQLSASGTRLLLDALVAAGLLTKTAGRYRLTSESADHLVATSPYSRVASHRLLHPMWTATLDLAETVRTGHPASPQDYRTMDPVRAMEVLRGLRGDAIRLATLLVDELRLEQGMVVADIGGGSGGAVGALTELVDGLDGVVVELPAVAAVTRSLLAEVGRSDIVVVEADCLKAVPGSFDRIWCQFVTQTMAPQDAEKLILNSAAALTTGGSIHLVNIVVDAVRTEPRRAALFNVALFNMYDGGVAHSVADYERWLRGAGLTEITWCPVNDMVQMVSARRG